MATSYKVLGQNKVGTANTAVVLYYADPGTASSCQTIVSTITICNLGTSATTYSVAVVPSAVSSTSTVVPTLSNENYVIYNAPISANETISYTLGLTLDTYDKVIVNSAALNVSFNAFGSETK